MRDWRKTLYPAAFRGVPFHVEIEDGQGGRRLSISPIAYAESSVIEDMGRKAGTWQITAYTVGDAADLAAKALIAALDAKGPGLAVLPMIGPRMARVDSWGFSRAKYRHGYVAIDIALVEEGLAAIPFAPMAAGAAVAQAIKGGLALAGAALSTAVAHIDQSRRSDLAATAEKGRARAANAISLTRSGEDTPDALQAAASALDAASVSARSDPAAWASACVDCWRAVAVYRPAVLVRDHAAAELAALSGTAPADAIERAAILGAMAIASARAEFPARRDAQAARAAIRGAAEPVLIAVADALGADAYAWLAGATGEAAIRLSRQAVDRAPLVRVEFGVSLPSVAAAYALYGDANRAIEIVDRNRVATPFVMPAKFEAVAP